MNPFTPLYSCTLFTVTPDPTSTGTSTEFLTSTKQNCELVKFILYAMGIMFYVHVKIKYIIIAYQ